VKVELIQQSFFKKGRGKWKMAGMKKEEACRWEKREVGMEG